MQPSHDDGRRSRIDPANFHDGKVSDPTSRPQTASNDIRSTSAQTEDSATGTPLVSETTRSLTRTFARYVASVPFGLPILLILFLFILVGGTYLAWWNGLPITIAWANESASPP
jgi:hypothetical protein